MADSADSIQAQLAALRKGFADQLPQRMEAIETAHSGWCESFDSQQLRDYHRLVHSLTGAGATFGFDRISQLARSLERHLMRQIKSGDEGDASCCAEASCLLDAVRAEVVSIIRGEDGHSANADSSLTVVASAPNHLVYLLAEAAFFDDAILQQLSHFGYDCKSYHSVEQLQRAVAEQRPAMILADIALAAGGQAGIEAVAVIQKQQLAPIPTIFLANDSSFDARLAAVRARGMAYLSKPFVIEQLVDVMDSLVERKEREPFRVLVVDDQPDEAYRHASTLRQAGMTVEVVGDSMKVFSVLSEFAPELILMDMYMPGCNGLELAAVIRQLPEYVGVPIVFLSIEHDRATQFDAMRAGGDDFLTKPIYAAELIQSVTIRTERYRTLRSLMSRDSLTGLLNHTHIMESLDREVARAERYGAALSYAMVDLDHFKRINDSYGHSAGDSVIRSLARLLQQRLRKTDIVGRYGGEEFAIIMPETPLERATIVMESVRRLFNEIVHQHGDDTFTVTLSCGIASMPPITSIYKLHETADKRLYLAKDAGRNRVISSDH